MSAFDYEAFCRRQGISQSPEPPNDDDDGSMIHMGVEQRMTSEEFELELADQNPIEMSKKIDLSKKQVPPDLNVNDRQALYQRLGLDVAVGIVEMSDEAPTERKSYTLPALEPMMQTWTYQAVRAEEQSPCEDRASQNNSEEYSEIDEENIDSDDGQENQVSKPVQMSALHQKLTLNDYVFDERQNLHEGLM